MSVKYLTISVVATSLSIFVVWLYVKSLSKTKVCKFHSVRILRSDRVNVVEYPLIEEFDQNMVTDVAPAIQARPHRCPKVFDIRFNQP